MLTNLFFILATTVAAIYCWLERRYAYWKRRKVPHLPPNNWLFGNETDLMLGRKSFTEITRTHYAALAPHKFGGIYSFQNPVLYLLDPELVKNVLTRDFSYFYDRGFYFANKKEPLTQHMFNLTGDEWRTLRTKLSPAFTSGKMKMMFALVQECVEQLKLIVDENVADDETLELKDLFARYATDVISSCAFGLKTNSLREPDSEFRRMGVKTLTPSGLKLMIRSLLFAFNPAFTNSLGIKSINDDINDFFINLVRDTVAYRRKTGVVRNDFLNLLMSLKDEQRTQSKKNFDSEFTIESMAAQCFLFFIAGFETSSNALSFAILELARNAAVQKRLQDEIDQVLEKFGTPTYQSLQDLKYMDKVIAETMRMYPATPVLMRTCTIDYPIPDSDVVVERGTVAFVPIYALHHDPQYFPDPKKFDPERFSEEGKASRPQYSYLPFGEGPKICIGMRFGLMEIKMALVTLLKNYNFKLSSKMKLPVKLKKNSPLLSVDGGIWIDCTRR